MKRSPKRGEVWHCDLEPVRGGEQRGVRPVLVLTREAFNRRGLVLICPITQGGNYARDAGFAVPLQGSGTETETETQGVVLTHQSSTLDWIERKPRYVETVPDAIIEEVMQRLATLLD